MSFRNNFKRESILLAANYSNNTGYAWNNIYKLFNVIAVSLNEKNIGICLSFHEIVHPIRILDDNVPFDAFVFDVFNINIKSLLILIKNIRKLNIKYVYFTDLRSWNLFYVLLRLAGVKKIIIHSRVSVPNPNPPEPETGIKKFFKTLLHKTRFLCADYVYVVSDFVRDRHIRKQCYPAKRIIKILNGVDLDRFDWKRNEIKKNRINIFCCSRASTYKGIQTLIEAIKIVRDNYSIDNFLVKYAGDGPDFEKFKTMVREWRLADKFIFLGKLENTQENTSNADIIVVPSNCGDACPSTVMEAMAAGKALVTTNVGGIPEIVGNSENVSLVPPSNSELLAKEIADLILNEDKRKKMGLKARIRAEEAFGEDLYHKKVIDRLLNDLCIK